MFDVFARYLQDKADLTEEELQQIQQVCIFKRLRKQQYLLQEGDINHHVCYIMKGCLRNYWVSEDGLEHILKFGIENW